MGRGGDDYGEGMAGKQRKNKYFSKRQHYSTAIYKTSPRSAKAFQRRGQTRWRNTQKGGRHAITGKTDSARKGPKTCTTGWKKRTMTKEVVL